MKPKLHKLFAGGGLALGNLVFVMREDIISPAGVKIKTFSQIFHTHCRTLDMPAGPSLANFRFPGWLSFFSFFPQTEILDVLLLIFIKIGSFSFLHLGEVNPGEFSVSGEFFNRKVDGPVFGIGIILL